jgi:hypothetical protein
MSKLNFKVSKIKAKSITHPKTQPDQIYLGYFVTLTKDKVDEDNRVSIKEAVDKKLSEVKKSVRKNTSWEPAGMSSSIELGDAAYAYITIAMYECDDGEIYKKLQSKVDELPEPESFEWAKLELPADVKDIASWLRAVWKLVSSLYSYIKQDDMFYTYLECVKLSDVKPGSKWSKTIQFAKYGGDYAVDLEFEVPKQVKAK